MAAMELEWLSVQAVALSLFLLLAISYAEFRRLGRSAWVLVLPVAYFVGFVVTEPVAWFHHALEGQQARVRDMSHEVFASTWVPPVEEIGKLVPVLLALPYLKDLRMAVLAAFCVGLGFGGFEMSMYVEQLYNDKGFAAAATLPWLRLGTTLDHAIGTALCASGFAMMRWRQVNPFAIVVPVLIAIGLHALNNYFAFTWPALYVAVTAGPILTVGLAAATAFVLRTHYEIAPLQPVVKGLIVWPKPDLTLPGWAIPLLLFLVFVELDMQNASNRILSPTDTLALKTAIFGIWGYLAVRGIERLYAWFRRRLRFVSRLHAMEKQLFAAAGIKPAKNAAFEARAKRLKDWNRDEVTVSPYIIDELKHASRAAAEDAHLFVDPTAQEEFRALLRDLEALGPAANRRDLWKGVQHWVALHGQKRVSDPAG